MSVALKALAALLALALGWLTLHWYASPFTAAALTDLWFLCGTH